MKRVASICLVLVVCGLLATPMFDAAAQIVKHIRALTVCEYGMNVAGICRTFCIFAQPDSLDSRVPDGRVLAAPVADRAAQ